MVYALWTVFQKDSEILTMEEWLMKMTEWTEMATFTCLIRKRAIATFISDWKHLIYFLLKRTSETLWVWWLERVGYGKKGNYFVTLEREEVNINVRSEAIYSLFFPCFPFFESFSHYFLLFISKFVLFLFS